MRLGGADHAVIHVRLVLVLGRRFLRDRAQAQFALIAFVSSAFLITMVITLAAFSPSGDQVVERDLGRFGHSLSVGNLGGIRPGDDQLVRDVVAAGRAAGAADLAAELLSLDLRHTGTNTRLTYRETVWAADPFPRRFVLTGGRWPTRPGEVVVTNAETLRIVPGAEVSTLSGRARFRVVGVAADRYYGNPAVLAAPGTWAGLDKDIATAFASVQASPNLYWGAAPAEPVIAAVSRVAARYYRTTEKAAVRELAPALRTVEAAKADQQRRQTWVGRAPAAYQAPSWVLPVLAVLLVFGLNDRRLRRSTRILRSVGVPPRVAVASVAVSSAAWTLAATLAGAAAGVGLGAAARLVLARFIDAPLPPLGGLGEPILRLVALTLAGCMAASLLLMGTGLRQRRRPAKPAAARRITPAAKSRMHAIRLAAATLMVVAAALQVPGMNVPRKAMVFAAMVGVAVLLVTPDIVRYVLRRLPERGPRSRLAGRQLTGDHRRAVIAVAVLATALGGPLGFLTLLHTMIVSVDASNVPDTGPGQVAVSGSGGFLQPPLPALVNTVRTALPGRTQVQLRSVYSEKAGFVVPRGTDVGYFLAVDTPQEVAALAGRPLTGEQTGTLQAGGILSWDDPAPDEYVLVSGTSPSNARETPPLPARQLRLAKADWNRGAYGIMLTTTVQRLKLPLSTGAVFFTGVSDEEATAARQAALAAGLNTRDVLLDEAPPPPVPPVALYASAIGLFALILLVAMAVARGQVSALRAYLGTLIAVGVPTAWARHVLIYQQAVTVALSTLLAALIAIPPVIVAAWRLPGYVLSIPWDWLALVTGAFYAATLAMTLLTARRLRARDRTAYTT